MNRNIFRKYDIRGVVGDDLTKKDALKVGKGYGSFLIQNGANEVVVARDCRPSSLKFKGALIRGLLSTGCSVCDIDQVPTPVMYFTLEHLDKDGGIIVTASHNPSEYNGFKMRMNGFPVFDEDISEIYEIIESENFEEGSGSYESVNYIDHSYRDEITEQINPETDLNIVIDGGNGTAGPIAEEILKDIGVHVHGMNIYPDGEFPNHLPDPTVEEHLESLSETVREKNADLGLAYDGDGDRVGAVDENGRIVWADQLLQLFAKDLLEKDTDNKNVVFDVKCSQGLVETVRSHGGVPVFWQTGYPLIQGKMEDTGALLGGEMSGHIYFSDDYYGFDDGIYASCRLVEYLSRRDKSFSDVLDELPDYVSTPEIRQECPDDEKFQIVDRLKRVFTDDDYEFIDVDGIRIMFEDGWALIRASNTQPVIVFRMEAKTQQRLDEIKELIRENLKEHSDITPDF